MNTLLTPSMNFHGVLLKIFDKGVLLSGPAGCGKSDCALGLLARGHRLIADDAPLLYREGQHIIGVCPDGLKNMLHVQSLGIVDVRQLFGEQAVAEKTNVDLIIKFVHREAYPASTLPILEPVFEKQMLLEMAIPSLSLMLGLTNHRTIIIESAVKLCFTPPSPTIKRLVKSCDSLL